MKKSELDLLVDISNKLDRVIGLLAIQHIADDENIKVKTLYDLGLEPVSVAEILGMSPNAVRVRMSRIRKKSQGANK